MQLIDLFPGHLYNEATLTRSMINLDNGRGFLTFEYRMHAPLHESGQQTKTGIIYLDGIVACQPYDAFPRQYDGDFRLSSLVYEVVKSEWLESLSFHSDEKHHYLISGVHDQYLAVIASSLEIREETGFRAF